MRKKNYNKSLKLIYKIQNIRKKNNVNWMDVLRLAFKHDPVVPQRLCQIFARMTRE